MAAHRTDPVNLRSPGEFIVRKLADLVIALTGSGPRLIQLLLPVADPRQRRPDIGRAGALLDWQPSVPLAEGLARMIPDFVSALQERGRRIAVRA